MRHLLLLCLMLTVWSVCYAVDPPIEELRKRTFQLPLKCDGQTVMVTFVKLRGRDNFVNVGIGIYGEPAIDTATKGRLVIPDSVVAPDGKKCYVRAVRRQAFAHCTGLTEVVLPQTLCDIGDQSFLGCTSLRQITIPASIKVIYPAAFRQCPSLRLIRVEKEDLFTIFSDIFDLETVEEAILMTPAGKENMYRNSLVFGLFRYRMEDFDHLK